MVDISTKGCDPQRELMCLAHKAWRLAIKLDKQKAASLPPGQSKKIKQLLQELNAELEAACILMSQSGISRGRAGAR